MGGRGQGRRWGWSGARGGVRAWSGSAWCRGRGAARGARAVCAPRRLQGPRARPAGGAPRAPGAARQVKPGERVGGSCCPGVLSAERPARRLVWAPGRCGASRDSRRGQGFAVSRRGGAGGSGPAAGPRRPDSETTQRSYSKFPVLLLSRRLPSTVSPGLQLVLTRPDPGPPGREPGLCWQVAPAGSLLVPAGSGRVPRAGHLDTAAGGFRGSPGLWDHGR